jgi:hypothetical protein
MRATFSASPALRAEGACLALLLLPWCAGAVWAQAEVYRCTAPDGSIEFRQHPCHGRDDAETLLIEDNRTGWVPPKPTAEAKPKARKTAPKQTTDRDRYADRCWSKRQQLERIENELRAGYTVARGERLKQRRREAEAWINRFCR